VLRPTTVAGYGDTVPELSWSALSVDYQRILRVLADRDRLAQGPLTCQEMAAAFGLDPLPAK